MKRRSFFKGLFGLAASAPVLVKDVTTLELPVRVPAKLIKPPCPVEPYILDPVESDDSFNALAFEEAVKTLDDLRKLRRQKEGEFRFVESEHLGYVFMDNSWMPFIGNTHTSTENYTETATIITLKQLPASQGNKAYVTDVKRLYECVGEYWELKA